MKKKKVRSQFGWNASPDNQIESVTTEELAKYRLEILY